MKAVFLELEMPRHFAEYEEASYKKINGLIESIPAEGGDGLKREVFEAFLAKIYKRQK